MEQNISNISKLFSIYARLKYIKYVHALTRIYSLISNGNSEDSIENQTAISHQLL